MAPITCTLFTLRCDNDDERIGQLKFKEWKNDEKIRQQKSNNPNIVLSRHNYRAHYSPAFLMDMGSANAMTQGSRQNPVSDLTRVEDYLEVVYELIKSKGYARSSDIAERLGVKSPSVTNMLQRLDGMGLIVYERYRGLTLTEKGKQMARFSQQKHVTITRFLTILGVGERHAKLDAEGIEHHVHKDTVNCMERFVDFVAKHPSWFRVFGEGRINNAEGD
jgi:Mn-dependent DtxR family transcriptional regulator